MKSPYRSYWATAPSKSHPEAPKAGFQTLWVQEQQRRAKAKNDALRAQHINSNETF